MLIVNVVFDQLQGIDIGSEIFYLKMFDFLKGIGVLGVLLTVVILLFLPLVITVVVGVALANALGFTGLVWWCFVILFYLVITAIIGRGSK